MRGFAEEQAGRADVTRLARGVGDLAHPLTNPADLDPLLELIGDAHFVLLGEASHGTSEFYTWRTAISRRLIEEKGFSFIAVEGDWPDCYRVNRYVKGFPGSGRSADEVLHAFERWPTWMWANLEVVELCRWLRAHNDGRARDRRVGFYGLDVYSLWESMHEVIAYLERVDPEAARAARRAYRCFEPYGESAEDYARATAIVPTSCENEAVAMLRLLREGDMAHREDGPESYFNAEQNALVARNAERYYRTMVRGGPASWNVRDHHMVETLERLMAFHGPAAKAIVWEHNTHVGDARFTDMARAGMVNVGQLVRQAHGSDDVAIVGFGTYRGSVIAAEEWGAPMQEMRVPEARRDSYESVLHHTGIPDFLLPFAVREAHPVVDELREPRGHRAIGVVYHPELEHHGNYVPTILPERYDAFIYLDETRAVSPLHMPVRVDADLPETYPSGV
ncbi:MAG TPA: erythromycin esterase family protein [Gemmatimonadaceae bacterium]|nr:erythromycin esterase family protein [Gemmatimonadaceae bacterium]